MKRALVLISLLTISVHSVAAKPQFRKVSAKTCDGIGMPVEVNEIVMLDMDRSEIGFGIKAENGCASYDSMSTLTVIPATKKKPYAVLEAVEPVGHKSTCSSSVRKYQGLQFQTVTVEKSQIVLSKTGGCEKMSLILE